MSRAILQQVSFVASTTLISHTSVRVNAICEPGTALNQVSAHLLNLARLRQVSTSLINFSTVPAGRLRVGGFALHFLARNVTPAPMED